MPRNVRNFWIELHVDGKKTSVATGPVNKTGGFSLTVQMRDSGNIVRALHVRGYAHNDGRLELQAYSDNEVSRVKTGDTDDIIIRTRR